MFWLVSAHLSVHTRGGGTPARSRQGGYPSQVQVGGTPPWVPPIRPGQGVPQWGSTPPQVIPPRVRPGRGVPHLRYPPSDLARAYPDGGGRYPTSVVLDTQQSVCFLRSRRRTFLFSYLFSDYQKFLDFTPSLPFFSMLVITLPRRTELRDKSEDCSACHRVNMQG